MWRQVANGVDAALAVAAFLGSDGAMLLDQAMLRVRARTRSREPCVRHARRTYMRAPLQIHRTRARTRAHANQPIALAGCTPCIGYSKPGEPSRGAGGIGRSASRRVRKPVDVL